MQNKPKAERRTSAVCYFCGKTGHVKFDCRQKTYLQTCYTVVRWLSSTSLSIFRLSFRIVSFGGSAVAWVWRQVSSLARKKQIANVDVILRHCRRHFYNKIDIVFSDGKFSVGCNQYGIYHSEFIQTPSYLRTNSLSQLNRNRPSYPSLEYFWKNITRYRKPVSVVFRTPTWDGMVKHLGMYGYVKFTVIAEDICFSPSNIFQVTEIMGEKHMYAVKHRAVDEFIHPDKPRALLAVITKLYDEKILAPRRCADAIIYCLLLNKHHLFAAGHVPKDVMLIILTMVWQSRLDADWRRDDLPEDVVIPVQYL